MSRVQESIGKMRVLQANMHRSKTADALMEQMVIERRIDVVAISEQYKRKTRGTWLEDESGTAAIWIPPSSDFQPVKSGGGNSFVFVQSESFTLISCYLTPSDSIERFEEKLTLIEDRALEIEGPLIMAGDLNSRAIEWGMSSTNPRGRRILETAARTGLLVANIGNTPTFVRSGCEGTIPDVTLVSESSYGMITNWRVLQDYTGSDHRYIMYNVTQETSVTSRRREMSTKKWNAGKLDPLRLIDTIDRLQRNAAGNELPRSLVSRTMDCIVRACDAAMPRVRRNNKRSPIYWWNEEIAESRRICLRSRRKLTRAKKRGTAIVEEANYKEAKNSLKLAINRSKRQKWEELRTDINNNPWGLGYKIVMKKLGSNSKTPQLDNEKMQKIVDTLFPTHVLRAEDQYNQLHEDPPPFTETELRAATSRLKSGKAPGPDGVPVEALKVIADRRPELLLTMYNTCLHDGFFPETWKIQRLVLISKGKGNPESASAYRPLCMLDTAGKLFERLLKVRITAAVEASGGLSSRQHGFRPGKSTIGAIQDVISSVELAQSGSYYSRRIVLLATLDIRNAFNSVKWDDIIAALENRFSVPEYLMRIIRSYLKDRTLIYKTSEGTRRRQVTSGAAQGSILGPDLWNASYDQILEIEMPDQTHMVAFADDIAAVIIARDTAEAQRKLHQVMLRTRSWLEDHNLTLAAEKTEIILLTKRHIPLEVEMQVFEESITSKKDLKYLGMKLDSKLSYWAQIKYATIKATEITTALSRLLANIGGPTESKRKLLLSVINSVLLYGSEIWADSLNTKCKRKTLASVQRTAAIRVASAYRTVSEAAIMVISGTVPIDLLAKERRKRWLARQENAENTRGEIRQQTLCEWQHRWDSELRGRWTAKIIRNIPLWTERKFGEVNFYLTQFLSGHGYFCKYLYRMGKINSAACIYGDADEDDAEHTVFCCMKYENERSEVTRKLGHISVNNIINKMLASEEHWTIINAFIVGVLKRKKRDLENHHHAEQTTLANGVG